MRNAKIPARLQSPYMMKNKERNQHYFESAQIDYRDEIIMGFIFANEDDKNVRITMDNERSKKRKTLLSFFKHKENSSTSTVNEVNLQSYTSNTEEEQPVLNFPRVEIDLNNLERDPAIQIPIWQHPINQQDEIRRSYIKMGLYQPKLDEYPRTKFGSQTQYRRFQYSWFEKFPWVNDGVKCPLLIHVGGPTSSHSNSVKCVEDLMKVSGHIDNILNAQSLDEVQKNRLRLKTTIESIRWLSLQACAFRGHDESSSSKNRGNFIEMIKLMGRLNVNIGDIVLEKAPRNATYTSPTIQKEILHIFANKVRKKIREEIGDAKFCILVDEGS
ncbi:uncharacterized protein LOC124913063 [Impatiens glandulifera]|uniref:uncharacterized protein LOC124913063 n=1 Tax=Impatiens glandulifera TaxID=253017 RepID=UPI001FB0D9CF|nr:uncharacterized protein LOC124913063 [Impatiens glandulifera]